MKKRLLYIGVILVVVLSVLVPVLLLADSEKYFEANGNITGITPGIVYPVGSGWWQVAERQLFGTISGDISGDFTMTYKGKFLLETQEGTLQGKLSINDGTYILSVEGESQPLEYVPLETPLGTFQLPKLTINGDWCFIQDTGGVKADGEGSFTAGVVFIPTSEGHVGTIMNSIFTMSGYWKADEG